MISIILLCVYSRDSRAKLLFVEIGSWRWRRGLQERVVRHFIQWTDWLGASDFDWFLLLRLDRDRFQNRRSRVRRVDGLGLRWVNRNCSRRGHRVIDLCLLLFFADFLFCDFVCFDRRFRGVV